ncbi:hypothetical protein HHK36_029392 [Tetracentron sinense]|uniref:TF-B3 domain-containing protein n=1 Tax=Tetracentron sinense TaxID=13715 RepID=A0A834YA57_TETSI|nr:hypothetical protein HHK36_032034 [Tetracentron sinense]KAF8378058.1 hypothetical protein HHK36_029392 [Tetracentron sinense]
MAGIPGKPNVVTMQGDKTDDESDRNDAGRDLIAATSFGANRKKRMARQRRTCINTLFFASSRSHVQTLRVQDRSALHAHEIDARKLRFLLQKELKNSDVSPLGRIVLPKRAAEASLPNLNAKEGIFIGMDDMDGLRVWSFKYRFWPNNDSRMYILENTGEFVRVHGLQLGDFIMLYKDDQNQKYVIRARKSSDQDIYSNYARNDLFDTDIYSNYARNDLFDTNAIKERIIPDVEVNESSYFVNFPKMDDASTSFIYDNTIVDDFPMNFSGGSISDYPRLDPLTNFGSVENLYLDDF